MSKGRAATADNSIVTTCQTRKQTAEGSQLTGSALMSELDNEYRGQIPWCPQVSPDNN